MIKKIITSSLLFAALMMPTQSLAMPACLNFIKTIDWRYFADEIDFRFKGCRCEVGQVWKAGWEVSLSEVIMSSDSVNDPWMFPCYDIRLDTRVDRPQGNSQASGDGSGGQKNYHMTIFPVFGMLNMFQEVLCFERLGVMNLALMSELLPQARNDVLANIVDGGVTAVLSTVAAASSVVDCASSTAGYPLNSMFWTTGCWTPPGTGSSFVKGSKAIEEAAAEVQKGEIFMHKTTGLTKTSKASFLYLPDSVGSSSNSMCEERLFFERIKTQYTLQLNTPTVGAAFTTGEWPLLFTAFKNKINSADNITFWVWRKRDYCAGAYKCRSTFGTLQK